MESNTHKLFNKINSARTLLSKVQQSLTLPEEQTLIDEALEKIDDIENDFRISSVHVYMEKNDKNRMIFSNIISIQGYSEDLDMLVEETQKEIKDFKLKKNRMSDLQKHFSVYPVGTEQTKIAPYNNDICDVCGEPMISVLDRAELVCRNNACCSVKESFVFEEIQMYNKSANLISTHGKFTPVKHFEACWEQLLARESEGDLINKKFKYTTIEALMNALKKIINRDKKIVKLLSVDELREMLSEIGRPDLNKNTSLLLKKLTGIGPPQLSNDLKIKALNLFMKAIEVSAFLDDMGINRNYYPYYMFKILFQLIPNGSPEKRVLYYIHFQGDDTVTAKDIRWERICGHIPELVYEETDTTISSMYSPIDVI